MGMKRSKVIPSLNKDVTLPRPPQAGLFSFPFFDRFRMEVAIRRSLLRENEMTLGPRRQGIPAPHITPGPVGGASLPRPITLCDLM